MDIFEAKQILDDCLDDLPEASLKPAYGFPCYFAAGKVFGLYDGDFIVLRFEETLVTTLVSQGEGYPFKPRPNITSAGNWIKIAHEQLESPERLRELICLSYETRVSRQGM